MLKKSSIIFSLLLTCALSAQAFSFEPITQDYTPSGRGANNVFKVSNSDTENVAIKITIRPRRLEPDGTEVQGELSDLFLIYPKQIILKPGESRSIRVKWLGDPEPDTELPFRIIAAQVPVSFSDTIQTEGGQITLTYRYEGNIYIVPPGAKPKIGIKSMKREVEIETLSETIMETVIVEQDGEEVETEVEKVVETEIKHEFLVFEIENSGNRHTLLNRVELKLKRNENDPKPIILDDNDLMGVAGENMLAKSVRVFRIPVPDDLWEGPVYGSIRQVPAK